MLSPRARAGKPRRITGARSTRDPRARGYRHEGAPCRRCPAPSRASPVRRQRRRRRSPARRRSVAPREKTGGRVEPSGGETALIRGLTDDSRLRRTLLSGC
eukprot:7926083-Pyramimonas_sp.AAC.1